MAHVLFHLAYNRCGHLKEEYKLISNGISESVYSSFPN